MYSGLSRENLELNRTACHLHIHKHSENCLEIIKQLDMRQTKLKLNSEHSVGQNSYLPLSATVQYQLSSPLSGGKNRFYRFFQALFKPSNDEASDKIGTTIADIKHDNLPENYEEQSLQELENCADAARKAEGVEQYDWD